jgi:hypothetical protein
MLEAEIQAVMGGSAGYTRIGDTVYVTNFTSLSTDEFVGKKGVCPHRG